MEKYLKYLFFLFFIFVFLATPNVFAETSQSRTINSSIGKIQTGVLDSLPLSTDVSNTNMTVGFGNYYYLQYGHQGRHSYFRRYYTNMTTSLTQDTTYHVRIVFFYEAGVYYNGLGLSNRSLNYNVGVLNNGVSASQVSSSITRSSTTNPPWIYDRIDIYFKATQTTNNLSISIGELTTTSYMYYGGDSNNEVSFRIGVDGIYVWNNAIDPGTNEEDMIKQQKQSNSFLSTISQKVTDITIMVGNLLQDLKDKIDDFKNSFIQHITNFKDNVISTINNFKDSMQNRLDDIKNFFSGSSIDETDVNNFFNSLEFYDDSSLGGVITAPVDFISSLGSTSCSPLSLTAWNKTFSIPCGDTLLWNRTGNVRNLWNIIFGGAIIFRLALQLFKVVNDAVDPTKDDIGGLQI